MKSRILAAVATSLLLAGVADATTYVGTRTIGTGSVNLSITTDDTIGVLGSSNILSWTIDLINTDGTFTLTQANSQALIAGNGLSATATDLLFDFGLNAFALFQAPSTGSGQTFYCLQGAGCYSPTNVPGEAVEATADYVFPTVAESGVQVIASTAEATVPEPASWAMMIAGFGLVGATLRRRSATRAAVIFG